MTRLNFDDLPDKVRKQLAKQLGDQAPKGRSKASRAGLGHSVPCAGMCTCGEPFEKYSDYEKHRDTNPGGGHRWVISLGEPLASRPTDKEA